MNEDPNKVESFPPLPPLQPPEQAQAPPPLTKWPSEVSPEMGAQLGALFGDVPGQKKGKDVPEKSFNEIFPGQQPMSEAERTQWEIRDIVRDMKVSVDNLPQNIAQAMGGP